MKTALVCGAGGFIGSNLVEYLIDRAEHEVLGVDVLDVRVCVSDTDLTPFDVGASSSTAPTTTTRRPARSSGSRPRHRPAT